MRQLFYFILVLFSHLEVFSFSCDPSILKSIYSNQTFISDNNGELIIKMNEAAIYEKINLACFISNLGQSGITVEYYTTSPCQTAVPFKTDSYNIAKFSLINIPTYTNFLKFKTGDELKYKLKSKINEPEQKTNCNYFLNRRNSFDNPVILSDSLGNDFSFSDCNTGCDNYNNINNPIKWYEIEVLDDLFIEFIEQGTNNFSIEYYGIKNDQVYYIQDQYLNDGIFLDVSDFSKVIIGIYAKSKIHGTYSFQIKRYKYNVSCVDFIGDGDTLITTESIQQSQTQVFKGGDTITFQYKLLSWVPIRQNWIHGLSIEYGDGWEGLEIDTLNGNPNLSAHSVNQGDSTQIRLDYENDENYYKVNNINQGNLYVPGIYMNAEKAGPNGPNSSFKWGKKLKRIKGDFNNPLVVFEFRLIAKENEDCETPLDGFVQVVPISDYFTGRHTKLGCEEIKAAELLAEIVCCQNPARIANQLDTVFCEGQDLFFSFKDTVEWKISESVYGRGISSHIKEYINQKDIDSLEIIFKPVQNQYCLDSFSHKFYSVKRPDYKNLTKDNLCEHEQIDLPKLLKLKDDEIILNKEQFNKKILKHFVNKDIEILNLVVQDTFGCESPIKIEFISDPNCRKQLLSGYVNPNPMVNYSRLYVSNKTTDPDVKVFVLNSSKDIIDQFLLKVPENFDGYFDFDSEHLLSGEYHINLSNSQGNYSFSFIKIN